MEFLNHFPRNFKEIESVRNKKNARNVLLSFLNIFFKGTLTKNISQFTGEYNSTPNTPPRT